MARAKSSNEEDADFEIQAGAVSLQRIANLLALILTKDASEMEKVKTLSAVGYSPSEIAKLLGKLPNTVSTILYKSRKGSQTR